MKKDKMDFYAALRNAIVLTFWKDMLGTIILDFVGDGLSIFYAYFIREIVNLIDDKDASAGKMAYIIAIFSAALILA